MKHIIFGGDGFLGTELAKLLAEAGQQVLICDEKKSEQFGNYERPGVTYLQMDVTDKSSFSPIEVSPDDVVYHFAARLLVPILPRGQRKDYFWQSLVCRHPERARLDDGEESSQDGVLHH